MIKRPKTKLGIVLAACTIVSLLIALGAFIALDVGGQYLIDEVWYDRDSIRQTGQALFEDFIEYLNNTESDIADGEAIQTWLSARHDLMLLVYDPVSSYFSAQRDATLYATVRDAQAMYDLLSDEYGDYWYSCPVMKSGDAMRSRTVKIMYFPMYRAKTYARYGALAVGVLAFTASLFLFIRKKTKYLALLSAQLRVMQGGDLSVPMSIRGNDEMTSLAEDIEEMRKSFIERLETEEKMRKNNADLLTAMSHDLRTPLTALIGYLDIIDLGRYDTQEQLLRYAHSGKLKAYQIKEMTDKLFEYFLVYSAREEASFETEEMDAATVVSQMLGEDLLLLREEGFASIAETLDATCAVRVNAPFFRRVFDNILSNIRKYADPAREITVRAAVTDNCYTLTIQNYINDAPPKAESSGIGLATCKKIMESHGGSFSSGEEDGVFICVIRLPAAQ